MVFAKRIGRLASVASVALLCWTAVQAVSAASYRPAYDAVFTTISYPTRLNAGQTGTATITMKNMGTSSWKSGFELRSVGATFGTTSVRLTGTVSPGKLATFRIPVRAPQNGGNLLFQWQMSRNGQLFGQPTKALTISVNGQQSSYSQCSDGYDNDNDGRIDMNDYGCDNPSDNSERDSFYSSSSSSYYGVGQADLSLQVYGPTSVNRGDRLTYTFRITNNSNQDARHATLNLAASPFTFLSSNSFSGCSRTTSRSNVNCDIGLLRAYDSKTFDVVFEASSDVSCGTYATAAAQVTSQEYDPSQNNNYQSAPGVSVYCNSSSSSSSSYSSSSSSSSSTAADLSVQLTAPSSVTKGNALTYTATVTNVGPSSAFGVQVSQYVPANVTLNTGLSTSGCAIQGTGDARQVVCDMGSMDRYQSKYVTIALTTDSLTCNQNLQSVAFLSSNTPDPYGANNASSVVTTRIDCAAPQGADLVVTATGSTQAVRGAPVNYVITARNNGPAAATFVNFQINFPAGFTLPSVSGCTVQGTIITCSGLILQSGESKIITLSLTAPTSIACPVSAQVQATAASLIIPDPVTSNNIATMATLITCPAS